MHWLTAALSSLLLALPHRQDAPIERSGRPNVVLVLADDLGYGDLGCTGHPALKTPALDRLAASGVRLTDYYAGATVCTPSRMALLTGSYPVRLGWTGGVVGFGMGTNDGLHPEALTLAELFRDAGYATGISGKWHLGSLPETRPRAQGFESATFIAMSNNQTKELWRGDEVVEDPFDNRRLTRQFTDEALRFIRSEAAGPFFLYLPYSAPHFPVQAHPEWDGRSDLGAYGDVVEELDACVGEILDLLKELDLTRRTLVVFTSDNGPNPGEAASSLPFRGEKWSALEGGTRVPALVAWPGTLPEGIVHDGLASAMDLLPTLCRAAGIGGGERPKSAPPVDGLDLWDSWRGHVEKHPREELLFWHGQDPTPQAIRVGDWKLFLDRDHALAGIGTKRRTPEQAARLEPYLEQVGVARGPMLFDLADDPGETVDRSADRPDRVEALRERYRQSLADLRSSEVLPVFGPADR